jgi:hypothetical protein
MLIVAVMAAGLAVSSASAAPGKGKAKGKSKGKGETVVVFTDHDRQSVRTYWVDTYGRGKCPPGLAKKHNGCLPPGQAKKRYVVGQRLPAGVVVERLPPVLLTRLGPTPAGYEYVMVDGDIVKLALGTRLVVDAIHAIVD